MFNFNCYWIFNSTINEKNNIFIYNKKKQLSRDYVNLKYNLKQNSVESIDGTLAITTEQSIRDFFLKPSNSRN